MIKPFIENNNVYLSSLIDFIATKMRSILKFAFFGVLLFTIYFFVKSPKYIGRVSFYTNYTQSTQSSVLSFLPSNFGGVTSSELKFSISNYINSDKFLEDVVKNNYDINGELVSLVDFWGEGYDSFFTINPFALINAIDRNLMFNRNLSSSAKKLQFAKEKLTESLSYSEDRKSSLTTIEVKVSNYDYLSESIINQIYQSIINYSNEVNNVKASEKRQFIAGRLLEVKNDLEKTENEMLDFMENNKSLASPSLILKKDRIQRDITLYSQLHLSLSDQLELAKIDEKDNTSSIFLLDQPQVYSYKSGRGLINGAISVFFIFFILGALFQIYRNRHDLFQFDLKDNI